MDMLGALGREMQAAAAIAQSEAAPAIQMIILRHIKQRQPVDREYAQHYRERPSLRQGMIPIELGWITPRPSSEGEAAVVRVNSSSGHINFQRFGTEAHRIPRGAEEARLYFWWEKPATCIEKTWGARVYMVPGWRAMKWVNHPGIRVANDFVVEAARAARSEALMELHKARFKVTELLGQSPYLRKVQ